MEFIGVLLEIAMLLYGWQETVQPVYNIRYNDM
jgi:hypothetical protein